LRGAPTLNLTTWRNAGQMVPALENLLLAAL
jgi:hypothetical protein